MFLKDCSVRSWNLGTGKEIAAVNDHRDYVQVQIRRHSYLALLHFTYTIYRSWTKGQGHSDTVKPSTLETSKEFDKCRFLNQLIMECCKYLFFLIELLYGAL